MTFESVDKLQQALTKDVFYYAKDSKKAAGRALGTLVEVITYYLLKSWGLNDSISIERSLAEYGNPEITHNVEYSLQPVLHHYLVKLPRDGKSITATKILAKLSELGVSISEFEKKNQNLLSKDNILRNACTIAVNPETNLLASFEGISGKAFQVRVFEQSVKPYTIFECKRVGVEEGNKKGPQTIEKAKQGAYVARTVSSLQKIRLESGEMYGVIHRRDNSLYTKPYSELLEEVITSHDPEFLRNFILTVGVVSNHGNWFTDKNQNKELKVLAQSYDWLIFLTDKGLSDFVEKLILKPSSKAKVVRDAFLSSYADKKTKNQFTKVQMNADANLFLLDYFRDNLKKIEGWFNVISPQDGKLAHMKTQIEQLHSKHWEEIL
jgi:hypothetical protein